MSAIPYCDDVIDPSISVYQLADVAKRLDVPIVRVHQMLRDRQLLALKRNRVPVVPKAFFDEDGRVLPQLRGLLAVLHDGGFGDDEILEWLFHDDDTLPGSCPIAALHTDSAREVMRRAQALAF